MEWWTMVSAVAAVVVPFGVAGMAWAFSIERRVARIEGALGVKNGKA